MRGLRGPSGCGLRKLARVPLVDRAQSILVIVDAQPNFIAQNTMSSDEQAAAQAASERLVWIAGIATFLNVPIVVVEEGPERAGKTIPELLKRLPTDTAVHIRRTFSVCAEPTVVDAIRALRRSTVVVVGFETDTCVAQSAIELQDLGLRVVALQDAMYSAGALEHERGLRRMRDAGVEINDCKGITFEWARVVDAALELLRASHAKYGPAPIRL